MELDLSKEDLPTYSDGEVEFIGTDMLDNADSSHMMDAISRIFLAEVEVTIRWSELTSKPFVASYKVRTNGHDLIVVESSPNGEQIHLSKINPFNSIFFAGEEPEEARKNAQVCLAAVIAGDHESPNFWDDKDEVLNGLGDLFARFFYSMKFDEGVPGLTKPINLLQQKSALPNWGKNLVTDRTIWRKTLKWKRSQT